MKTAFSAHTVRVGGFFVLLYAICLLWPNVYAFSADALAWHLTALQFTFPGFKDLTTESVLWGGVLSFVYGAVGSIVYHAFHNKGCCKGK